VQVWLADPHTQAVPLEPPSHHVHPCGYDYLHASVREKVDSSIGPLAHVREALIGRDTTKVRNYSAVHPALGALPSLDLL
jgi:hypothetical protein